MDLNSGQLHRAVPGGRLIRSPTTIPDEFGVPGGRGRRYAHQMVKTGNGSRVYVTSPVKIKTRAPTLTRTRRTSAIRVLVPDMCTTEHRWPARPPDGAEDGTQNGDAGHRVRLRHQESRRKQGTHSVF